MNPRSIKQKLRSQYGFTLLELLVVIAVIGVLASLAVPRMQNQLNKAKFVDVINSTGPYKTAVEMCFLKTNALSACDSGNTNGYVPPALTANGNVDSLSVAANGTITATGSAIFGTASVNTNGVASNVPSITYILKPSIVSGSSSGLTWAVDTTSTCIKENLCN